MGPSLGGLTPQQIQQIFNSGLPSASYITPSSIPTSTTLNGFSIGDRVIVKDIFGGNILKGKRGIIADFNTNYDPPVGVAFDENINGHNLDGKCKFGHGRWGNASELIKEDMTKKKTKNPVGIFDLTKLSPLVVSKAVREEIEAVLKQHKNSGKMFDEWGLGKVIEYGRGMTFLFYGPPGTGKTWAATCIAKVFGRELLSIGAAEIQTSEPGGANRNIQNAFKAAKEKNKILFLDECDSLITSRNDVGMILGGEINTLLTEIEKCEGVVVLATNRIENLDSALERRISLIVEFPEPDFEQRIEIWQKMLPKKMPLGPGVTAKTLAEPKLTGGQIKNVILQAARLAIASGSKRVNIPHFESAIDRIHKSKSLMGNASRYHQGIVKDDLHRSRG